MPDSTFHVLRDLALRPRCMNMCASQRRDSSQDRELAPDRSAIASVTISGVSESRDTRRQVGRHRPTILLFNRPPARVTTEARCGVANGDRRIDLRGGRLRPQRRLRVRSTQPRALSHMLHGAHFHRLRPSPASATRTATALERSERRPPRLPVTSSSVFKLVTTIQMNGNKKIPTPTEERRCSHPRETMYRVNRSTASCRLVDRERL